MLKGPALRFYEDNVEKKGSVEKKLFHSLVLMFQLEYSTKERENEL